MKKTSLLLCTLLIITGCSTSNQPPLSQNNSVTPPVQNVSQTPQLNQNTTPVKVKEEIKEVPKVEKVALKASRAPMEGCTWQEYNNNELAVAFLYQTCGTPETIRIKNNALWYGEEKFMELGKRKPGESDIEALKREYFQFLTQEEQKNCMIASDGIYSGTTKINTAKYEFIPKPGISEQDEGPTEHCGSYGLINGVRYFEFQKNKNTFAFLSLGQDPGWFDGESLTLLK